MSQMVYNDYISALEHENKAKSTQISMLYRQLSGLRSEKKGKVGVKGQQKAVQFGAGEEVTKKLEQTIAERELQIQSYVEENQNMFEDIEKIEKELEDTNEEKNNLQKYIQELHKKIKKSQEQEIREEIKQEIREEIREGIQEQIREEIRQQLIQEIRQELMQEIRQQIRQQLRAEIRNQDQQKIENQNILRDLRKQVNYLTKQNNRYIEQNWNLYQKKKSKKSKAMDLMSQKINRIKVQNRQLEANLLITDKYY